MAPPRALPAALSVLALLAAGLLVSPADAARPKPAIGVHPTRTTVTLGSTVALRITVSRSRPGVKIKAQRKTSSGWKTLKKAKLKSRSTLTVTVKPRVGTHRYRVVSTSAKRLAAGRSRSFTLRAVRSPAAALAATRATILKETNAFRARAGLRPLRLNAALNNASQSWAGVMAARRELVHDPDLAAHSPAGWRSLAENIASGQSPASVTNAWFESPGHRANLLGDFTDLGVGYVKDSRGRTWFVQRFLR